MALADIYQLIHKQAHLGEVIQNVYFYQRSDVESTAGMLIAAFIEDMLPEVRALQTNDYVTTEVSALSLGDLTDFDLEPLNLVGTYGTGVPLPSFNAIGYTLKLNTRAVSPGSKRIAGIPAEVVTEDFVTSSGYLATMETLRLAMLAQVQIDDAIFFPVVVKRTKTAVAGTVPQKYKYTLPVAGDPLVVGTVAAVLTSPKVTHQVSRGN